MNAETGARSFKPSLKITAVFNNIFNHSTKTQPKGSVFFIHKNERRITLAAITELTDLVATHVSYVHKGANKKEFFLMKSDDGVKPDFQREFDILTKSDEEKKLVYGVVYEPDAVDTQNEFAKAETIEAAAHKFLTDCRNIDLQHNFTPGVGTVVESYIAPADIKIEKQEVKKGSWILVTKASDEVWEDIKKGVITGYSMAGKAMKTLVTQKSASPDDDVKGFFDALKKFFVNKSDEKGESLDMDKTELKELMAQVVGDAIKPLMEKLTALENPGDVENPEEPGAASEVDATLKSVLKEALEPLAARLEAIEKARGVSRQAQEPPAQGNVKKSVFAGLNI